jgi:hypothetical protein
MTEAEFVKVTDGLLPPPAYFGMNVAMNKSGIESFETVFNQGMKAIKATDFEVVAETGALILTLEIMAILQKDLFHNQ